MTEPVVVFDSGVIGELVADRDFRAVVEDLVRSGWTPVIPTVVLAEAITGRAVDAPVNQAVRRIGTVTTDEPTARRAGALRSTAARAGGRRIPSGIDALVAAHAVEAGRGVVFTTDPTDLRRLLDGQRGIRVEVP